MPNFVTLNQFSDTITEATIVRWLVRVGDRIDIGDALVEVENEIATMEITSLHKGIIGAFYASEGMTVPVGHSLAVILDEGEDLPENILGECIGEYWELIAIDGSLLMASPTGIRLASLYVIAVSLGSLWRMACMATA